VLEHPGAGGTRPAAVLSLNFSSPRHQRARPPETGRFGSWRTHLPADVWGGSAGGCPSALGRGGFRLGGAGTSRGTWNESWGGVRCGCSKPLRRSWGISYDGVASPHFSAQLAAFDRLFGLKQQLAESCRAKLWQPNLASWLSAVTRNHLDRGTWGRDAQQFVNTRKMREVLTGRVAAQNSRHDGTSPTCDGALAGVAGTARGAAGLSAWDVPPWILPEQDALYIQEIRAVGSQPSPDQRVESDRQKIKGRNAQAARPGRQRVI